MVSGFFYFFEKISDKLSKFLPPTTLLTINKPPCSFTHVGYIRLFPQYRRSGSCPCIGCGLCFFLLKDLLMRYLRGDTMQNFCGIAAVPHPYLQLLTPQYHRHPVMNALHECVGLRGENHIFTLPGKLIPDSRQVQGLLLSWKIETVLPLLPCLVRSPLIKTCGGYYAHLSSGGHPLYRRPAAFLFVEVFMCRQDV